MRPDYKDYDKVPPYGKPENGPAEPHDTYGNPQCPPHDFYGLHGTMGPGYHLLPVPPNTWGMTTEQQLLALGGKVDELIRTFNEYDRKIYGAWDAIVNSAVSNDAYYKAITVEDGYIGDTGAKYKVVHIPFTDKAGQPIYLELGVPYNNTTNAGLTEECFDASERVLADKLVPAVNSGTGFTGLAMYKHAPIEGGAMPMSMPAPGSSGWTLGITENGYLKLYDTANNSYENLKWDNVRNAMGVVGLLVNNREKATNFYAVNKGETVARVGVGMNYDTKERFIVVVQGDDTHGTTSDLLADIFIRYNCNVAVETANGGSAFGLDKGEMMFMPATATITLGEDGAPNTPHTGAFWYITKRRHYHNEYVKDVAVMMQRLGRHIWASKIYSKSIDDIEDGVKELGDMLKAETKAREDADKEIHRQIDEEILGRETGDTEVTDTLTGKIEDVDQKLEAAIPKLEKQITDAVYTLNNRIDKEVETLNQALSTETTNRTNADIKEVQTTIDGNKRTYTLVNNDGSSVSVGIEVYDYQNLSQNITAIMNFEEEFRDFYTKYTAWKAAIDQNVDSLETQVASNEQRIGQNETDIATLKTTANQLREQMTALDQTVSSFQAQIVQMELTVENLKQAWTQYHAMWVKFVDDYNTWHDKTETTVTNHESRIASLEREYSEQEQRITVMEQVVQTTHETVQQAVKVNETQQELMNTMVSNIASNKLKITEQDTRLTAVENLANSTADTVVEIEPRLEKAEKDGDRNGKLIINLETAVQTVNGEIATLKSMDEELQRQITEIDNKETANAESIGSLTQTVATNKAQQDLVNSSTESRMSQVEQTVAENLNTLNTNMTELSGKVDGVVQSNEELSGRMDEVTKQVANAATKEYVDERIGEADSFVKKTGDTMTGDLNVPVLNTAVIGNNVDGTPHVIQVKNTAEVSGYYPTSLPEFTYENGVLQFTRELDTSSFAKDDTAEFILEVQVKDARVLPYDAIDGLSFTVKVYGGSDETANLPWDTSEFTAGKTLKIADETEDPLTADTVTWLIGYNAKNTLTFSKIEVAVSGTSESYGWQDINDRILTGSVKSLTIHAYRVAEAVRLSGADAKEDNEYVTLHQLKDEGAQIEANNNAYSDLYFVKKAGDTLEEDAEINIPGHKDYDSNENLKVAPREILMKKDADPHSVAGREVKETRISLDAVEAASLVVNAPNGLSTKHVIVALPNDDAEAHGTSEMQITPTGMWFRKLTNGRQFGLYRAEDDDALEAAIYTSGKPLLARLKSAIPTENTDVATKSYVDTQLRSVVPPPVFGTFKYSYSLSEYSFSLDFGEGHTVNLKIPFVFKTEPLISQFVFAYITAMNTTGQEKCEIVAIKSSSGITVRCNYSTANGYSVMSISTAEFSDNILTASGVGNMIHQGVTQTFEADPLSIMAIAAISSLSIG